jgi:hypothetical protein
LTFDDHHFLERVGHRSGSQQTCQTTAENDARPFRCGEV